MTVSTLDFRAGPFTSGATEGFNRFTFLFKVFIKNDVRVVQTTAAGVESDLTLDVDYTVTLNADQNNNPGGFVDTVAAYPPANGKLITLVSNIPETQGTQLPSAGQWNPVVVENALDKAMLADHQVRGVLARAVVFPISDTLAAGQPAEFPARSVRASKTIVFDANGDIAVGGNFVQTGIPVSAFMQTVLDDTTAGGVFTTLGISAYVQTLLDDTSASTFMSTLGFTAYGKTLIALADAAALKTNLGISAFGGTLIDDADAAAARVTLGLGTFATQNGTLSAFGATLVDDADAAAARATLLLGTMATQNAATVAITGGSITGITDLAIADGGTGASTAATALAALGGLALAGGTMSGTVNFADQIVQRPLLVDYAVESNAASSSGGVLTLDMTTGNAFSATLTENVGSVVVTNPPASGTMGELWLALTQGAGAFTVTWAAAYKFPAGTDHTMSAGAGAIDVLHLKTLDGGASWFVDFQKAYA